MKIRVRRVGNSLGVILPKVTLKAWGIGEGGVLELTERSLRPPHADTDSHQRLDEHKRRLAEAVITHFPPSLIRAHSLANLHRWRNSGVWISAYQEWEKILKEADDGALFAAMLGRDERANRLRQSPPYVGLLPRSQVKRLNEEATG